jgi:hypothetical protein
MKYKIICGDLHYEAESKNEILKVIKDLILPFIQIKVDIKITKESSIHEGTKLLIDPPEIPKLLFGNIKPKKRGKKSNE